MSTIRESREPIVGRMFSMSFGPFTFDEDREVEVESETNVPVALVGMRMAAEGYRVFERTEVTVVVGEDLMLATAPGDVLFPSYMPNQGFFRFVRTVIVPPGTRVYVSLRLQPERTPGSWWRVWRWVRWFYRAWRAEWSDARNPPTVFMTAEGISRVRDEAAA